MSSYEVYKRDTPKNQPPSMSEAIIIDTGDLMDEDAITSIQNFIDQCDEAGVEIDFTDLMDHIYDRRVAGRHEQKRYFDPIDDADVIARHEDIVGFMRPDQIMTHFDGLLATESSSVADRIVSKMGPDYLKGELYENDPIQTDPELRERAKTFLNDHIEELLAAGAKSDEIAASLPHEQLRESRALLIEGGASRFKTNKKLAVSALRRR